MISVSPLQAPGNEVSAVTQARGSRPGLSPFAPLGLPEGAALTRKSGTLAEPE